MSKPRLTIILTLALAVAACSDERTDAARTAAGDTVPTADLTAGTMPSPVDTGVTTGSPGQDTAGARAGTPTEAMRNRAAAADTADRTRTAAAAGDPVEPATMPVAVPPTAGVDTGAAPAVPSGQQDPARLLRRTAALYAAMNGMKAEFSMNTRNPLLQTRASSRGTLYQRRPDRIKLDFSDPAGDVIVGDGTWFWVFYPSVDAKQVIRTPAAGTAGVVDLQAQFVGDPLKRFDHTVDGREAVNGRNTTIISLVPRENLGYAKLKVWIDDADFLVRRFEITDPNGVTRLLDLTDLVLDPTLPDGLFVFTPPPGARVVERE